MLNTTALDKRQIVETAAQLNVALSQFNGYFNLFPLYGLCEVIGNFDLDASKIVNNFKQDCGRMNVALSSDIYLCVTWYRVESGRFEIVAYASSNYDDSLPYDTKWSTLERRSKINKLNAQLRVLRSYYATKGLYVADVADLLKVVGFDLRVLRATALPGVDGRVNIEIGQNCFLVITWYQMPSGSYEMTAYATAG